MIEIHCMAGQGDRHPSLSIHIPKGDVSHNRINRFYCGCSFMLHCSARNRTFYNAGAFVVVSDFYTGDDCLLQVYVLPSELGLKIWA